MDTTYTLNHHFSSRLLVLLYCNIGGLNSKGLRICIVDFGANRRFSTIQKNYFIKLSHFSLIQISANVLPNLLNLIDSLISIFLGNLANKLPPKFMPLGCEL